MALVTNISKTVEIPNETHTALIRKLSHKQLKEASRARQSEGVGFMKEMGGELLRALRDDDRDRLKKMQETQESMIDNYDRDTLLRLGVISWTYEIPPITISKDGVANGLDELDEPTAKFLAEQIFEFSRPQTPDEAKKSSSVSTSS